MSFTSNDLTSTFRQIQVILGSTAKLCHPRSTVSTFDVLLELRLVVHPVERSGRGVRHARAQNGRDPALFRRGKTLGSLQQLGHFRGGSGGTTHHSLVKVSKISTVCFVKESIVILRFRLACVSAKVASSPREIEHWIQAIRAMIHFAVKGGEIFLGKEKS